ncbi:hypothetical protein HK098_005444 [Nowakowskiella sp. JEL0407]|nr:hypothetical protein HK098_005444 [Nowakowskiella sp. JEL0407]
MALPLLMADNSTQPSSLSPPQRKLSKASTFVIDDDDVTDDVMALAVDVNAFASLSSDNSPTVSINPDSTISFGRSQECTVILEEKRISSAHCEITAENEDSEYYAYITDLSTNGTFINGKRLVKDKRCKLKSGDVISFGKGIKTFTFSNLPRKKSLEDDSNGTINQNESESRTNSKRTAEDIADKMSVVSEPKKLKTDEIESNLICGICHDLMHQAATIVPCMHSFCGGCVSDWVKLSKECPQCRGKATLASRNHTIDNLVDAFLAIEPEKARTKEELSDLEKKCVIKNDKPLLIGSFEMDNDDEEEEEEEEEEEAYPGCPSCPPQRTADGFQCTPDTAHLYCSYCARAFPDRPECNQSCKICSKVLCGPHLTNQCAPQRFKKICNYTFEHDRVPSNGFFQNNIERQIMVEYLIDRRKTIGKDVWRDFLIAKTRTYEIYLQHTYTNFRREFIITYDEPVPNGTLIDVEWFSCEECARSILDEALFVYRRDMVNPYDLSNVDKQVSAQLSSGNSLYTLNAELLKSISPSVIITQSLCEVCAIDVGTVHKIAETMDPAPKVVTLNPSSIDDVLNDIRVVGDAVGLAGVEERVKCFKERIDGVVREAERLKIEKGGGVEKNVLFMEWVDPVYPGGHWTPQLISLAGGFHPLNPSAPNHGPGGYSKAKPAPQVIRTAPEIIVIGPCGLGLPEARREADLLVRGEVQEGNWWERLIAECERANGKKPRVVLVDGNHMFNRPGPRLVDALEFLVGLIWDESSLIPTGFPWEEYQY